MIDERELQEYLAQQPKPVLRPFLATRVAAAARTRPRQLRTKLHLIWTLVLLACLAVCAQVHVPAAWIILPSTLVFVVLTRRPIKRLM